MISLKLVAAFCAAENTDEKKPPAPPGEPEVALGVRPPGVLTSSTVGVNGGAIAFDSLLGAWVAESDRTLR